MPPAPGAHRQAESSPEVFTGSEPGKDGQSTARRNRLAAFGFVLAGVLAIVLPVRRPPILDLPMLLDQAASVSAILAGERTDQYIDPLAPNQAGVLLAWIARSIANFAWAPRLLVVLVGVVWLAAFHFIAAQARRPVSAAILVSPLLFGSAFYAGFFNFLTGTAALAYWVWELRPERRTAPFWRIGVGTLAGALLLYWAHVLWLLIGGFAVATCVLLYRFRWQETVARVVGVLPVAVLVAAWDRGNAGNAWQSMVLVMVEPLDRVRSLSVASSLAMGGIRSASESVVLVAALGWIAIGLVRATRERGRSLHPFLALAAICFALVAVLAPDSIDKTMHFAWRWGGVAVTVAVLAVPPPSVPPRITLALVLAVAIAHGAATVRLWRDYVREALPGFEAALQQVPLGSRIVQIDAGDSPVGFWLNPVVHLYVYAATERGAEIPFRLADFGNGALRWRRRDDRARPDGFALWQPGRVRPADLASMTHVLMRCPPDRLDRVGEYAAVLSLIGGRGQWGLFEVVPGSSAPVSPAVKSISHATE